MPPSIFNVGVSLRRIALLVAATSVLALWLPPVTAVAGGPQPWGRVLVPGGAWAGGAAALGDLNVYSNGNGNQDHNSAYGMQFECVELAQRWAAVRFGEQPTWPISAAFQMWAAAPHLRVPFIQIPNGGGSAPDFGDLLVLGPSPSNPWGHVSVVAGSGSNYVDVVEQNWDNANPSGSARIAMQGTTVAGRGGLPVLGWLRGPQPGYLLASAGGHVSAFGGVNFMGDTGGHRLVKPVVGMARTPSGFGYWLVASDGGVFSYGDAQFRGSTGAVRLNRPIVGVAATPSGGGYWLVASDGGIFSFGDARFYGSTGAMHLNRPVVGMAATATGRGYWLVASDGGIFSFGDARFRGSTGAVHLKRPIVAMSRTPSGAGFSFGDARFYGSTGALRLRSPVVAMSSTRSGGGYWLAAADGGIFSFGDAPFKGSAAGKPAAVPAVGIAGSS